MTTLNAGTTLTISTYTPNAVSLFNMQSDITSYYKDYVIEGRLITTAASANLILKYSSNNGTSYYNMQFYTLGGFVGNTSTAITDNTGGVNILGSLIASNGPIDFSISLKAALTSQIQVVGGTSAWYENSGKAATGIFTAIDAVSKVINAVQLSVSTGTMTGIVHMKGVLV